MEQVFSGQLDAWVNQKCCNILVVREAQFGSFFWGHERDEPRLIVRRSARLIFFDCYSPFLQLKQNFFNVSGWYRVINCILTFRTTIFCFRLLPRLHGSFWSHNAQIIELYYVARSSLRLSNHAWRRIIYNVSTLQLPRCYQPVNGDKKKRSQLQNPRISQQFHTTQKTFLIPHTSLH